MSEKHLVCQGAVCQCKFGTTPDKLKVKSHRDYFVNDKNGDEKPIGSTKELGQTFEANSFGSCKKMNNNACKPNVTEWKGFYDKATLQNGGKILLETSKAVCAVAGSPCIDIVFHGQTAAVSSANAEKADEDVQSSLNPLVNVKKMEEELLMIDLSAL